MEGLVLDRLPVLQFRAAERRPAEPVGAKGTETGTHLADTR